MINAPDGFAPVRRYVDHLRVCGIANYSLWCRKHVQLDLTVSAGLGRLRGNAIINDCIAYDYDLGILDTKTHSQYNESSRLFSCEPAWLHWGCARKISSNWICSHVLVEFRITCALCTCIYLRWVRIARNWKYLVWKDVNSACSVYVLEVIPQNLLVTWLSI